MNMDLDDDDFLDQPTRNVSAGLEGAGAESRRAEGGDPFPPRGDSLRRSTSLGGGLDGLDSLDSPEGSSRSGDGSGGGALVEQLSRSDSGRMPSSGRAPTFRPPIRRYDSDELLEEVGGQPSASGGGAARSASMPDAPSRRTSTGDLGETDKRALIRDILRDPSLSQLEKRRTVQQLMDGRSQRRITIDCGRTNPYLDGRAKKRPSQCEDDGVPTPEQQAELRQLRRGGGGGAGGAGDGSNDAARGASAVGPDDGGRAPAAARPLVMQRPRRRRRTIDDVDAPGPAPVGTAALGAPDASPFGEGGVGRAAAAMGGAGSVSFGSSASSGYQSSRRASMETIHSENTEPSFDEMMRGDSTASIAGEAARGRSGASVTDLSPGGASDRIARLREAAIAEVRSQVRQEELAAKHPYKSDYTSVPAVAAGASDRQNRMASVEISRRAIETAPTCTHYERNCHIISPCCGATFGCRICHDDCPVLPPPLEYQCVVAGVAGGGRGGTHQRVLRTSSMPADFGANGPPEHHSIDRFAIKEVICRECYTRQGSKRNSCVNCGVQFGQYHCAICNLWMSNEERPYHCPDCGFCRVGGGENFIHCHDCGMCIDKDLFDGHNCKVGKYMSK